MMLLRYTVGVFLLALLAFKANAHPIKMTTSKLLYDKKANELTLTINFFEDDFSAHLERLYHRRHIDFATVDDIESSMIAGYVAKKMLLKANKKSLTLQLNSVKRIEENVVQVKLILPLPKTKIKSLEISDALLFDAFAEQVNIMHLDLPGTTSNVLQFTPSDSYKVLTVNF
jgi:hypothetical protein